MELGIYQPHVLTDLRSKTLLKHFDGLILRRIRVLQRELVNKHDDNDKNMQDYVLFWLPSLFTIYIFYINNVIELCRILKHLSIFTKSYSGPKYLIFTC